MLVKGRIPAIGMTRQLVIRHGSHVSLMNVSR